MFTYREASGAQESSGGFLFDHPGGPSHSERIFQSLRERDLFRADLDLVLALERGGPDDDVVRADDIHGAVHGQHLDFAILDGPQAGDELIYVELDNQIRNSVRFFFGQPLVYTNGDATSSITELALASTPFNVTLEGIMLVTFSDSVPTMATWITPPALVLITTGQIPGAISTITCCGAWTVTLNVHEAVFPEESTAVQTTGVVPTGKIEPEAGTQVTVVVTAQLLVMVAVGVGNVTTADDSDEPTVLVMSAWQVICGGVVSATIKLVVQLVELPD